MFVPVLYAGVDGIGSFMDELQSITIIKAIRRMKNVQKSSSATAPEVPATTATVLLLLFVLIFPTKKGNFRKKRLLLVT
ncbi:hypothetical protein M5K25_019423 [Dendrobium thyrsiflorum]|uniref:Uncharacterized protein n=1 Tax=Dendrobium thyrsiflorum TaxID=117978 RepID=A0ABD0ULQ8_DENTH